jgi:hypothetical protein
MADNDFDSDAMLAFFGQMGKGVDELKSKVTNLDAAGNAMRRMTHETERFGQTVNRQISGPMRSMDDVLFSMVGKTAGLALAVVGVAKAFDGFAASALRSRNFAIDTGFTSANLKAMRVQLSAAGISAEEAASGIASMGAKLQEVLALQESSSFYRELQKSSPLMAENVRHLMNAGDQQGALNYLQEMYNKGGERFKIWLSNVTGISKSAWEAQKNGMKGLIPVWSKSTEEAEKYHRTMVNLGTIFNGVWKSMTGTMLDGLVQLTGSSGMDELNEKSKKFADDFKIYFNDTVIPTLKETLKEVRAIVDFIGALSPSAPEPEGYDPDEYAKSFTWGGWKDYFSKFFKDTFGGQEPRAKRGARETSPGEQKDLSEEAHKSISDMRDILQKWEASEGGFGSGGRMGLGGRPGSGVGRGGFNASGGTPEQRQGGPVGLSDETGRKIDDETMRQVEVLGRAGDTEGLQRLFAQKGYRMSGPACGIVATQYVKSAGFQPPKGSAIAANWHGWGHGIGAEGINEPGRPFGSMVGTYYHQRYGGGRGLLGPNQIGGHVMTPIPGTYDPKTKTFDMVDQYGFSHKKRSINDVNFRYVGDDVVAAARARAAGGTTDRGPIDRSIVNQSNINATKRMLNFNFKNVPDGVKTNVDASGDAFSAIKMNRSNQIDWSEHAR